MESLHLIVLALTALCILYADHEGVAYMRGTKKLLSEHFVRWSHRIVWTGLILMIVTGITLMLPSWEYRLQDPAFYVKIGLVLVLVVNGLAIGSLSKVASKRPFSELSYDERRTLLISGSLSGVGWVGATLVGFFFL